MTPVLIFGDLSSGSVEPLGLARVAVFVDFGDPRLEVEIASMLF